MQNYPNPFNPTTKIAYQIANAVDVKLTIYNVLGQEIIRLVDQNQKAGRYELLWDGRDTNGKLISSGIYFFRLQAGEFVKTHKMTFIK
jgi:flagellar hook assembly protein FlgD